MGFGLTKTDNELVVMGLVNVLVVVTELVVPGYVNEQIFVAMKHAGFDDS